MEAIRKQEAYLAWVRKQWQWVFARHRNLSFHVVDLQRDADLTELEYVLFSPCLSSITIKWNNGRTTIRQVVMPIGNGHTAIRFEVEESMAFLTEVDHSADPQELHIRDFALDYQGSESDIRSYRRDQGFSRWLGWVLRDMIAVYRARRALCINACLRQYRELPKDLRVMCARFLLP